MDSLLYPSSPSSSVLKRFLLFLVSFLSLPLPPTIFSQASPPTPSSPRTRTNFDFDWKFMLGGPPSPGCDATTFPINLNTVQCLGLTNQPTVTTTTDCIAACCGAVDYCALWQYSDSVGCWIGNSCANNLTANGWVGGARSGQDLCPSNLPCSPAYDDSPWRTLNVPHDYIVEQNFTRSVDPKYGALPRNTSWYRKHFYLNSSYENQLVWLTFDGVFRAADIYINGAFVKHHEEGYTSFHVYLHNASVPLYYGNSQPNILAVYVDPTQSELWSWEGGGIFRHVYLESANSLSFVPWSFYVPSYVAGNIFGTDPSSTQTTDEAIILPQIDIQSNPSSSGGGSNFTTGTVIFSLYDANNNLIVSSTVAYNVSTTLGWQRVTTGSVSFGSATNLVYLWNTAYSPPLYFAVAALYDQSNNCIDTLTTRIGIRSAVFDPRYGFVLNGVKVLLQGTSNHLGFGGLGMALPDKVMEFQITTLRSMGGNSFRTAHNPVAPELLDYADNYGMLIWEENRNVMTGPPVPSPRRVPSEDNAYDSSTKNVNIASRSDDKLSSFLPPTADSRLLQDAQDMVLRDRNHPCIIIWSLCNELGCMADDPNGGIVAIQFKIALYAADQSRPITGNTVQTPYLSGRLVDSFAQTMDVQSFSHEPTLYPLYHAQAPYKALGGGEDASCLSDRGYYGPTNRTTGHIGPIGGDTFACAVESWQAVANVTYVYGSYAWTGFDYYGETYPLGYPDVSSHFGIWDLVGFPKDSVGYYRAWWLDTDPITNQCKLNQNISLTISPNDWTEPVPIGSTIDIYVFTCANTVELYFNNVLVNGSMMVPRYGYVHYPDFIFTPGNITAIAYDTNNNVLATRTILTAGNPSRLSIDSATFFPYVNVTNNQVTADGQDSILLGVTLYDNNNVVVPNNDVDIIVSIDGPGTVIGLANGDPADRTPIKQLTNKFSYHGLLRIIVQSTGIGMVGNITVSVNSNGIQGDSIVLYAV